MSSQTPTDETLVEHTGQLVDYMLEGAKPRERWVIGTEHEKVGWRAGHGYPTYDGAHGIGTLLETLACENGWEAVREGEAIIALTRDNASITLEPGGQLELSGAPLATLAETRDETVAHLQEIRAVSGPHGITWSGLGMAPVGTPADMPRMPKARYGVMRRYLPTRGDLALHMMHQTCTVQANFDFADEDGAMRKLRASLLVQPLVTALFASSPVVNGVVVPERSYRAEVWLHTDDDRFVFPRTIFEPGARLSDYVEWALDVPLFFIHRDGAYIDCAGLPFRRFLEDGHRGTRATVGDFELHLSTLFPDARLKKHLEVRGADMGDGAHVLALPALHVGLLYDDEALAGTLALLGDLDYDAWWRLRRVVPKAALDAKVAGTPLREVAAELLRLSRRGLERVEPWATKLLAPLEETVAAGVTPAERLLQGWNGDPTALLAATCVTCVD